MPPTIEQNRVGTEEEQAALLWVMDRHGQSLRSTADHLITQDGNLTGRVVTREAIASRVGRAKTQAQQQGSPLLTGPEWAAMRAVAVQSFGFRSGDAGAAEQGEAADMVEAAGGKEPQEEDSEEDSEEDTGLGCPKCRYAPKGCGKCRGKNTAPDKAAHLQAKRLWQAKDREKRDLASREVHLLAERQAERQSERRPAPVRQPEPAEEPSRPRKKENKCAHGRRRSRCKECGGEPPSRKRSGGAAAGPLVRKRTTAPKQTVYVLKGWAVERPDHQKCKWQRVAEVPAG